jgi:hypothetical protein
MRTLANTNDRNELLARLQRLEPDSRALWGRMTAGQMICHLSDSFRVGLDERTVSMATGFLQRTVMKWFALQLPLPWPKGMPTRPEVSQEAGGTPPIGFDADRDELIHLIDRFSSEPQACERAAHPFFVKMKYAEWMRWGYLHTDHHLRQFGV